MYTRSYILFALAILLSLIFTSCKSDSNALTALKADDEGEPHRYAMTSSLATEYNDLYEKIAEYASQGKTRWSELTVDELWPFVRFSDSTVIVGVKVPGVRRGFHKGKANISYGQMQHARNKVATIKGVEVIYENKELIFLVVQVDTKKILNKLRKSPFVEYVEPMTFFAKTQDDPGVCFDNAYTGNLSFYNGDALSEPFVELNLVEAWGSSSGDGVTIGQIDSGISESQSQLLADFDSGFSTGRSYDYYSTVNGSWDDDCIHGTKVGGVIVAPHNTQGMIGVAHQANYVHVKAFDDPVVDNEYGWTTRVIDALEYLANHYLNVRVINMSFGSEFTGSSIEDEIQNVYYNDGIMMV